MIHYNLNLIHEQMKTLLLTILILISAVYTQTANAQDAKTPPNCVQSDIAQLKARKKAIRAEEKAELKNEVKEIEQALKAGKITKAEAKRRKNAAAEKHARNIENKLDIIDSKIALIKRNGKEDVGCKQYKKMGSVNISHPDTVKEVESPHRTHSHFVIAFGLSNAIGNRQPLNDSPYKIGGSRFFTIGYEFSTALIKSGFLRLDYGIRFQFNGLKPTRNRYFVRKGDHLKLKHFHYNLDKSKLRQDNFVIPIYLEIGPADATYHAKKYRFGIGGYIGLNLRTVQKLKYNHGGHHVKRRSTFGSVTSNFIYGLGAYVGYDMVEFYVRYGLNGIFKNNPVEQHLVAAGLRFNLW